MKKLPYGISNYQELIEDNYYYVDKTKYIEKLENLAEKRIMFLRPRKFGKTLFTSVLENYYDIKKTEEFEKLYKDTYIGKNPTNLKNSYHILRFNFSGIDTTNTETTIKGFKREVASSIKVFVEKYVKLIFYCIVMNLKIYSVKSELEVEREYPDIVLIPRDRSKGYNAIMVEFKYLKKSEEGKIEEKQREAKAQIERYANTEEMKDIEKMNKYTIVVVNDKLYVEKIKS